MIIATIKLDAPSDGLPTLRSFRNEFKGETWPAAYETRALVAYLGGYNSQARGVDLAEFERLQRQFNETIYELAALIQHAKTAV